MSNIDDVLKNLNPKIAGAFIKASDAEIKRFSTPSLGINLHIGGIVEGGWTVLYGNRGSGKTAFALQCVAEAQRVGKSVAWFDVEKNFSPQWAQKLGVTNPEEILIDRSTISISSFADKAVALVAAGVDLIVVDSISQLLPQSYFEDPKDKKSETLKDLANTGQIGTFSKNIGQAINMISSVNQHASIIVISQVRNNIGTYTSKGFQGGLALEHAASTTIKLWRTPSDFIEEDVQVSEELLIKKPVGCTVNWYIEKNRGPGMNSSGSYDLYNDGDFCGIDKYSEIINYGLVTGDVRKSAAWYYIGDTSFQGKAKTVKFLRQNPDIANSIEKSLNEKMGKK